MPRPAYSPPARRETVYYTEGEESPPQPAVVIDMEVEREQDDYAEKLSAICDWLQSLTMARRQSVLSLSACATKIGRSLVPAGKR
jgi:hypothetical protein